MSEQVKESSTKPGNRSVAAFLTRLTQVCTTKLGKTIGAILLFLVILFTVRALQTRFDIVALWEDDLRCYESFLSWDFWTFVFPNSRPASAFYLWVGFAIFGANVTGLVWYWAFWFSAVILSAFFLFYEVSKRKTLSLLLAAVLLFSRLNWYYYIVHMGVMESITLLHAIWAAFFAIRFIRTKRWYWALIAFAVAIMATFSHERFLGLPPIITVLAVIYLQKWPRKVIGGGIGVLGSFSLFFFKTVILHQPFWVSGGAIETTFDIRILITHFFQIFVNCFALWGDAHWIGGMSNALLSGEGIGLMVFSIIGFSLLFLIALWGFVRIITTKNWAKFAIALLLTGIYLVLAMGGSITQKDVETRWIFPPLLFLLSFIAVTMTEWKLPTMKKEARQITFLWDSRLYLTSCTILMCVSSLCFNTYISNNRYRFYIDDWNASARLFKELLIDGYHTSGKEGVAVYTMTKHMEGARGILDQYGIKDYRVFTEQDPFPAVAPFADPYSVVINDTMVTPLLPTYQFDLWQTWVGHDFNFYTFASDILLNDIYVSRLTL